MTHSTPLNPSVLNNQSIILGVSGSVAAYKACELLRLMRLEGGDVTCALTAGGERFLTPLTLTALSGHTTLTDVWGMSEAGVIQHVEVARQAAAIVIAPLSANTLAKLASGRADDALSALVLASDCPVLLAPAMETHMWQARATQRNLALLLQEPRFHVVGPGAGALASGQEGVGRMSEPSAIMWHLRRLLTPQDWQGQRVVITAGPTREAIDSVRYLSNRSSGRMGLALAQAAWLRGAHVTLICGPLSAPLTLPEDAQMALLHVTSAAQMQQALIDHMPKADALFMAAAVCDYAPRQVQSGKLKKRDLGSRWSLALEQNGDLLQTAAQHAKPGAQLIGFAAETDAHQANAQAKLKSKRLSAIVLNDVSRTDIGFDSDDNEATLLFPHSQIALPKQPKIQLAHTLLSQLAPS